MSRQFAGPPNTSFLSIATHIISGRGSSIRVVLMNLPYRVEECNLDKEILEGQAFRFN